MLRHKLFRIGNYYINILFQSSFKRRTTLISLSIDNTFVKTLEATFLNVTVTISKITELDIKIWNTYKEYLLSQKKAKEEELIRSKEQ